jgi:kynurenine formamidase
MKVRHLIILSFLFFSCHKTNINPFETGSWIDLSYSFDENTIYWPTSASFALDTVYEGMTDKGYYYSAFAFCMAEHGGTHLDAPIHFSKGKQSTDEIPLTNLIGPSVVIDVSSRALQNPDYQISISDFKNWESEYNVSLNEKIVLIKTGYGQYWPDRIKYMGTDERGAEAVAKLHFPGIDPKAAQWIVDNRSIKAIGLDTPSIDYGQSTLFESHRILFKQNIPAFENVARLDQMPSTGALVFALPIKIKGGSGGPVRIVGWLSD